MNLIFAQLKCFAFLFATLLLTSCGTKKTEDNKTTQPGKIVLDSALTTLNQQILEDPENFHHYLERAKYYGAKEEYKNALDDIDRALRADSTKGEIYLYRGEIYWFQSNVKDAYKEYENCLRFEASNTDCLLKKASIDIALDNYDKALEHINNALREDEKLPNAYYLKGRLYRALKDTTLAASSYQTAIELDPDFYDAYIEIALLYANRKSDLALEYYNTAIGINPNSVEALYNKAMFLQETGSRKKERYQQAFECYDLMQKLDPTNATANFNKGFIYLEYLNEYDSGRLEFTKAIEKFPNYFQAYYNRGLCFESLSQQKAAENDYRSALKIQPTYTEAAKALSRVLGE